VLVSGHGGETSRAQPSAAEGRLDLMIATLVLDAGKPYQRRRFFAVQFLISSLIRSKPMTASATANGGRISYGTCPSNDQSRKHATTSHAKPTAAS
jgi:hypothetical protein